ncbi:MAG: holo-[acyl-carrier-protein] synthase [Alphaproteobacteria bacterium]|nr:holo-[acyl-carrier-protein] synthase [Alphaproteobacteria bacterium]
MICGIGTDLVEIKRIEASIGTYGDRFIRRIFTEDEQLAAKQRSNIARFYAMRFAAKEAAWKALSPGRSSGIRWIDLEVRSAPDGKPEMVFHGAAREIFHQKAGLSGQVDLSLSDDGGMALAFVVLSKP